MADIFLSYSRDDRPKAEQIAKSLEAEGFSVWWDKVLRAGQTYDEVTEGMLREARVVVVLWSEVSVKSKWVRAEATLGERTSTLVPAMIQQAERPIMFELVQTADLIGWHGDAGDPRWSQFVSDIRNALQARAEVETSAVAGAPAPGPDASIETTFWQSIDDSTDPADFEAYLNRYPDGHFAALAANRLASLSAPAPGASPTPTASATSAARADSAGPSKGSPMPMVLGALLVLGALGAGAVYLLGGSSTAGADLTGETRTIAADAPASPFADCETCPDMVLIAGGTYERGAQPGSFGFEGNEAITGPVTVPAFALARTEVTLGQWAPCAEAGACKTLTAVGTDPDIPATRVTWEDAQAYARWLSDTTGRAYRLPSEAEWEFAARAGTDTVYWWGDSFRVALRRPDAPVPAGSTPANPWGLVGMIGNVREWVQDCYQSGYAHAPTDGTPFDPGSCPERVLRGGAYNKLPEYHRAANRATTRPGNRGRHIGFRVATSDLYQR